jgi:predicted CXXCH cytochrome family protein
MVFTKRADFKRCELGKASRQPARACTTSRRKDLPAYLWTRALAILIVAVFFHHAALGYSDTLEASEHDFSPHIVEGDSQICSFCHMPPSNFSQTPLWAKESSDKHGFTIYSSADPSPGMSRLGLESLMCLSCHDGAIGFDALNGLIRTEAQGVELTYPGGPPVIEEDVCESHPVGINIPSGDGNYRSIADIVNAGFILFDSKIECATCHDTHNKMGFEDFLRLSQQDSMLCLGCHNR